MLSAVVFVPSAPLLVPELCGPLAHDTVEVRRAAIDAVTSVESSGIDRWIAVGAGDEPVSGVVDEPPAGSFARFGVDVGVKIGPPVRIGGAVASVDPRRAAPARASLSMLIAGWLRDQAGAASMSTLTVGPATSPHECLALGGRLAARLGAEPDAGAERTAVLVVGDGSTALTDKAPGGGRRETAVALNETIVEALGSGDLAALAALDPRTCAAEGVGGRVAWQVTAGLVRGREITAGLRYAEAPFGVGYVVAVWTLGHGARR